MVRSLCVSIHRQSCSAARLANFSVMLSFQKLVPIRLTQESEQEDGSWHKLMTYDLLNMKVQPQVHAIHRELHVV